MKRAKNPLFLVLAFIGGAFATLLTTVAFAHGGDASQIHGCVRSNGLLAGFVRIVGASTACANNETALDWQKQAPINCPFCTATDIKARTKTANLQNVNLDYAVLNQSFLYGENLSGSSFVHGLLVGINGTMGDPPIVVNFTNANFTDANISQSNLPGTNLTGVNLTRANASQVNLIGATLDNANFTDTNLQDSNLTDAGLTNVTWSNTTCPDGTNSNDNGNTCVGHLNP